MAEKTRKKPLTKALREKTLAIAEIAESKKAKNIRAFDVRGLTLMADVFVLCSAGSEPQMRAVADAARQTMREGGSPVLRTEGDHHSGWMIVDCGDVLFHVFRESARAFYDLDQMWEDAPEVNLKPRKRKAAKDGAEE